MVSRATDGDSTRDKDILRKYVRHNYIHDNLYSYVQADETARNILKMTNFVKKKYIIIMHTNYFIPLLSFTIKIQLLSILIYLYIAIRTCK